MLDYIKIELKKNWMKIFKTISKQRRLSSKEKFLKQIFTANYEFGRWVSMA